GTARSTGAGLISVLKAEPGPGPDRYTRKSTERATSLHLLNNPSHQLTNQGNQCDHTSDISTWINLVSEREQTVDCQG
ncbi:unnamed protein product, partial [Boreogadus saida]